MKQESPAFRHGECQTIPDGYTEAGVYETYDEEGNLRETEIAVNLHKNLEDEDNEEINDDSPLSINLISYKDKAICGEPVKPEELDIIKTVKIDGRTAYITRTEIMSENNSDNEMSMEAFVKHNDAWIMFSAETPLTEEKEEVFYSFLNSVRFRKIDI